MNDDNNIQATSDPDSNSKTPWHIWSVGVITLLWNAVGAMDFVMTQTKNEEYMKNFTPEQLEFFYGLPVLIVAAWAIAVWGGVLGSLLILLRKKLASQVLLGSFLAMIITTIHNFGFSNGLEVMGDMVSLVFSAAIFVVAFLLWMYAKSMSEKNILH